MTKHLVVLSLGLFSACTSQNKQLVKVKGVNTSSVIEAVKQPIYSANLIRKEIPDNLIKLTKAYEKPSSCYAVLNELALLDIALGPDLIDQQSNGKDAFTINVGQMLSKEVESNIPFNSIIKRLSGARKHEKAMLSAKVRGNARRSYLGGWSDAMRCSVHQMKLGKQNKRIN